MGMNTVKIKCPFCEYDSLKTRLVIQHIENTHQQGDFFQDMLDFYFIKKNGMDITKKIDEIIDTFIEKKNPGFAELSYRKNRILVKRVLSVFYFNGQKPTTMLDIDAIDKIIEEGLNNNKRGFKTASKHKPVIKKIIIQLKMENKI